jgi:hypothetical protein
MRFPEKELKRFLPGLFAGSVVLAAVGVLLFISLDRDESPEAVMEISPDEIRANTPVMIDGSGSTDPDGPDDELEYSWKITDTFETSSQSFEFSFPRPGNYTVVLKVTDTEGNSDTQSMFIWVRD